jgi:hypothetical protein
MTKQLQRAEIRPFIEGLRGKFFTIEFIKRSNGELRVMNCTSNYQSKLAGGDAAYNFGEKQLVPVWDLQKKGFRSIPLDSVLRIRFAQETYEVTEC